MTAMASPSPVQLGTTGLVALMTVVLMACGPAGIPSAELHPDQIGVVESGHDRDLGDWYIALGGSDGCYGLVGPAEFRGEFSDGRMVFESGLSLPLAIDISPGRPSDPRVSERAHICVDEDGEVVSYSTT